MKKLVLRKAKESDAKFLFSMISELAEFEKALDQVSLNFEKFKEDGFSKVPLFESIILELEGKSVGMALFYYRYSTWKGKSLYLEDFYILPEYRGNGFGVYTMKWLAEYAVQQKCGRFEWQVLDWNTPAISFYKKLGADLDGEWINCRLENDKLKSLRL